MIDLHCHSHFSDGLLSPALLMEKALEAGLSVLALTDHDTVAGIADLRKAAQDKPLTIINGIELSTRFKKYDIHVLGLQIDPAHPAITALIQQQNTSRIQRAQAISQRLATCGIVDAYDKACQLAGHERVGRPHFAQVMINEGLVADMKAAFKRYLTRGKAAYVPVAWVTIEEAVTAIIAAGGQAVLAHPLKYKLTRTRLYELINTFKTAGGIGIEVISGLMTEAEVQELAGLCLRFDLMASSGSDYHGEPWSTVSLGRQRQLPLNCTPIWQQWTIGDSNEPVFCNTSR